MQLPPEMEKMVDDIEDPVRLVEKRGIQQMLKRKRDAFMLDKDALGKTNLVQHEIQTNTQVSIKSTCEKVSHSSTRKG